MSAAYVGTNLGDPRRRSSQASGGYVEANVRVAPSRPNAKISVMNTMIFSIVIEVS